MRFCGIEVENRYFLAPMAGVTDDAFRRICEGFGAALTYTEMVSAKALTYHDAKTATLLRIHKGARPCFAQIFGSQPDVMAEGARLALEISGADGIDINMGCPVSKIVGNGEGSALMKEPEKAAAIVEAVRRAVSVPVTVKFRKGFASDSNTCADFARMMEQAGADAMCIHGRTRAQMYSGESDPRAVAAVKRAVSVPVIASGDLFSPRRCIETFERTGVDFVMIARGAEGRPYIFEDCLRYEKGEEPLVRTAGEIFDVMLGHAEAMCEEKEENKAMVEFRKHGLWYLGHFMGVKHFKVKMAGITRLSELRELCDEIREADPGVKEV